MLVEQHGNGGYHHALQDVERHDREEHQGPDAVNTAVDGGSHTDDRVHGHAKQFRELRQQIEGVEAASENGHNQSSQRQAADGHFLILSYVIYDGSRSTRLQPTTKFAKSPTNAVVVPFSTSFKSTLQSSVATPATGPMAKAQISTGISLKSNS